MRLNEFLEVFDEKTKIEIIDEDRVLFCGYVGDILQRVLNFRFVNKCKINNDILTIVTSQKLQDEMDCTEEVSRTFRGIKPWLSNSGTMVL